MGFWQNVDIEREFKNLTRKELAHLAGFSLTSLSTGIARNSIPSADVAYRIAKVLDVSIEYLLMGGNESGDSTQGKSGTTSENNIEALFQKYIKYRTMIEHFDKLPPRIQKSIECMIQEIVND